MGHYFKCLMNDESPIIETDGCVGNQGMTNATCEEEMQEVLGGMKCGKVVGGGGDEISVAAWKCMVKYWVHLLFKLPNSVLKTDTMSSEWRTCILVPILRGKERYTIKKNYRRIQLLSHTFKLE